MTSRLFHAVIAGGIALATPLSVSACSGDSPSPTSTDSGDDARSLPDTSGADAGHDAGGDADGGWPPTK